MFNFHENHDISIKKKIDCRNYHFSFKVCPLRGSRRKIEKNKEVIEQLIGMNQDNKSCKWFYSNEAQVSSGI